MSTRWSPPPDPPPHHRRQSDPNLLKYELKQASADVLQEWAAGPGENMREVLQEAGVCFSYYVNWMRAGITVEWGQRGGNNVRVAGKGEEGGGWE